MSYEQKDGSGSLFKNADKKAENHADYNGSIKIEGREYWLNAWLKKSKAGATYMSLSVQPKKARGAAPSKPVQSEPDFDDTIGF